MPAPIGGQVQGVGRESGRTCSGLVDGILRRLGQKVDDAVNRSLALEGLREAVASYNLERNWMDRRLTTDVNLADSINTYPLPARFRELVGRAFLVDNAGLRRLDVQDIPFEEYLLRIHNEAVSDSTPLLFTIQNAVDDGLFTVWPSPNATAVSNYPAIRLVYYADIPVCDSADGAGSLAVSARLEQAIFAEALYVTNDIMGKAEKAARYFAEAERMRQLARAYDGSRRVNWSKLQGRTGPGVR